MKNLMPTLKKLAAQCNCTVTDERDSAIIVIDANDGWSWDEGERSWSNYKYGSEGSYLPEWRQDAIAFAIKDLTEYPPTNTPYLHA
jgi:hypothetical protein